MLRFWIVALSLLNVPAFALSQDLSLGTFVFVKPNTRAYTNLGQLYSGMPEDLNTVRSINGEFLWIGYAWVHKSDALSMDGAIAFLSERIDATDKQATAPLLTQRGFVWRAKDDEEKGLSDFSAAIDLDPTYSDAFVGRGHVWLDKSQFDVANKDFDEALRLKPTSSIAYLGRAYSWWYRSDFSAAEKDFDQAHKLASMPLVALRCRVRYWMKLKKDARAIRDLTEIIELDPYSAGTFYNRACCNSASNDHEGAVRDFSASVRLGLNDGDVYLRRGAAYHELEDYQNAIRDYETAMSLEPENAYPYLNAADILGACRDSSFQDPRKAIEYATKACKLFKWKNSYALAVLARAHAALDEWDDAVHFQQKAIDASIDDNQRTKNQQVLEIYEFHRRT